MLKELYIENYKSLKNLTVQFKDGLNIIIGKNGSGKSNLLEFIDDNVLDFLLNDIKKTNKPADTNFQYKIYDNVSGGCLQVYIKNDINVEENSGKKKQTSSIEISFIEERQSTPIKYPYLDNNLRNLSTEEFSKIQPYFFIKNIIHYYLPNDLAWLNIQNKYVIENKEVAIIDTPIDIYENFSFAIRVRYFIQRSLLNNGIDIHLEDVKAFLLDNFKKYIEEISLNDNLNFFSPVEEVRINKNINVYNIDDKILIENLTFEFKINGTWVPWSYLSDGTKRLFYIIAEMCSQEDGLILIEEPELGIHPHQLYKLMNFIKEQSRDKQIIISTHSPIVLDILNPDELDRITIAKIENGSTQFHKLTDGQVDKAKEYMSEVSDLSYYWLHSDLESNG